MPRTSDPAPKQVFRSVSPYTADEVGLGDLIHAVAQPVAREVDRVAGTNLAGCGSCQKRRQRLNRMLSVKRRAYRGSNW